MIIQACLNGRHPANYHRALPVTIESLVRDGKEVVGTGASELHIHVRDQNGLESLKPEHVDAIVRALKSKLPGTLIGVSTAAWIENDEERTLAYLSGWTVLPDYASVNLGERNAPVLIERLHHLHIGVEAGLANAADAERLVELSLQKFALRILVEVDEQDENWANAVADEILEVLHRSDLAKPILLHGVNATAWPLLERAVESGFSTRIGLEDVSILPDGSTARSNADLVLAAAGLRARRPRKP
jgi:uncharacterized protein (DUF849 family)